MPTIRTTFVPDREIEVGDAELLDLQRQGLVLEVVKDKSDDGGRPAAEKSKGN